MSTHQYCTIRRQGELDILDVSHPDFNAAISLQGAQVLHFARQGEPNWLWLSETARFETGRPVRGGIPLCWPWFGNPAKNPSAVRARIQGSVAHGFARTMLWSLEQVDESVDGVSVCLALEVAERADWEGQARVELQVQMTAQSLSLSLTTHNRCDRVLPLTQALHTYLPTDDIAATSLSGLEGCRYVDTLRDWQVFQQQGLVHFAGETDRIYYLPNRDPVLVCLADRPYRSLFSKNSHSAVIWNPGPGKAQRLTDFPADAWQFMLCVETAHAMDDARQIGPGESLSLDMTLRSLKG